MIARVEGLIGVEVEDSFVKKKRLFSSPATTLRLPPQTAERLLIFKVLV
jgi:hypothetical protein